MDALMRCPFLSRVPQAFLQQTRKSLVAYAVKCPVMMELASRPLVRSLGSTTSSGHGQCLCVCVCVRESKVCVVCVFVCE